MASRSLLASFTAPTAAPLDKAERLAKRFARAERMKTPWLSVFEECFEYALPGKESMFTKSEGQRRTDKIFDETAVVGVQEFASRLQAGIMPTFSRWADLRGGSDIDRDQLVDVDKALDLVTQHVFEILQHSNLDQEIAEAFLDLSVGTAVLDVIDNDDPISPIRFTAVPLPHVYIDCGPDDRVDFIARKREVPIDQLMHRYPGAKTPTAQIKAEASEEKKEGATKLNIIEVCERDWSKPVETWVFTAYEEGECETVYTETSSGIGSGRFICFRWSKLGGEVWGRGPLLNALPAIKTCNLTIELILENAEMAITGLYTAEDDGTLNVDTIQLLPGTIIPTMPGSGGLKAIAQAGKFDVAQMVLQDMRTNIKKALYNDTLGNPDKTPASATEISARMADLSRQIGSAFGRLQNELVQPLIQRVIYILKKQGRIKLPSVNGREVKVVPSSPLSKAQAHEDVQTTAQFIGLLGQLFGPEMVNVICDPPKAASFLGGKLEINSEVLRPPDEQKQIMQQVMQAMQQQQGQPQATPSAPAPTVPGTQPAGA